MPYINSLLLWGYQMCATHIMIKGLVTVNFQRVWKWEDHLSKLSELVKSVTKMVIGCLRMTKVTIFCHNIKKLFFFSHLTSQEIKKVSSNWLIFINQSTFILNVCYINLMYQTYLVTPRRSVKNDILQCHFSLIFYNSLMTPPLGRHNLMLCYKWQIGTCNL